ncbi:MAG: magnesium-translocating P-type ATPase [bacterium]
MKTIERSIKRDAEFNKNLEVFWSLPAAELLQELRTTPTGLTNAEAYQRINIYGFNRLKAQKQTHNLSLFLSQFKSPIIIILLFAVGISFSLHDYTDALIILAIVLISGFLGFLQERGAVNAIEKLLATVKIKGTILRNGITVEIPIEEIVPGDIILLKAGNMVPGDALLLESKDLFVDEATLTGETYPVSKSIGVLRPETALSQRTNTLYMSTHVVSGTGKAVVIHTGKETEFGKIADRLKFRRPETEFERGVRRFGYLLMEITLLLVMAIFAVNVYFHRPVLESILFALALAIGLTPQLLPAIITINLSHGAKRMAKKKVIVKRLEAIENFGSMNILCADKTGTLTEGKMQLHSALDVYGHKSEKVLLYAYLNSFYETGFNNPIDEAIRHCCSIDTSSYQKLDEVPYDFARKRLSILVAKENEYLLITKGALLNVMEVCSSAETADGTIIDIKDIKQHILEIFKDVSQKGLRSLGVAYRAMDTSSFITKDHEMGMIFLGLLIFYDPLKKGIKETIQQLKNLGVSLKIVTGDNLLVAANVGQQIGLTESKVLTGQDLHKISPEALINRVHEVDIFAEVEPNQKEMIIRALKKAGHVVGYIGDGINDASAIHSADVGISIDMAVDVAKEAADFVLLDKDLNVLIEGIREGRMTFANTLKYVFMATSANFGNMFSMAGASLFLPFLPLLPKQILLTNLLTDFPEMTISNDNVDQEMLQNPHRWRIPFIRKFMMTFGLLSSLFDYLTFAGLLFLLQATTDQFRTGWFLESVISASLVVLIVRSQKPFFKSRPGKYLLITTLLVAGLTLLLPYTLLGKLFEFTPLPLSFLIFLVMVVFFYIMATEIVKSFFYKRSNL